MARKANQAQLESLKCEIEKHPGKHPGFFARLLGWHREQVNRALTTLNDNGVLLSEDEKGRLWPYGREQPD
ncbi:MAG: hypothetical protein HY872_13090 [Chloroflexi bacterium]|nr:hypothetical protein [Chloroflexota bacterium]